MYWGTYLGTLHPGDLCEPPPFAMPHGPRLDALPLFVQNLRSRSSPGIFGPALCPGSSTGVLNHLMVRGIEGRPLGPGHLHPSATKPFPRGLAQYRIDNPRWGK